MIPTNEPHLAAFLLPRAVVDAQNNSGYDFQVRKAAQTER
jgi:hypothetical protein